MPILESIMHGIFMHGAVNLQGFQESKTGEGAVLQGCYVVANQVPTGTHVS